MAVLLQARGNAGRELVQQGEECRARRARGAILHLERQPEPKVRDQRAVHTLSADLRDEPPGARIQKVRVQPTATRDQ